MSPEQEYILLDKLISVGIPVSFTLLGVIIGSMFAHWLAVSRESRSEERRIEERFREKYKLVTRTAYYLREDIKAYRIRPHVLNPIVHSFMRLRDSFMEFSEGLASDYLENILDKDTYTKFNIFTSVLVAKFDAVNEALRSEPQNHVIGLIMTLPLGQLKKFTDKVDEDREKGGDKRCRGLLKRLLSRGISSGSSRSGEGTT